MHCRLSWETQTIIEKNKIIVIFSILKIRYHRGFFIAIMSFLLGIHFCRFVVKYCSPYTIHIYIFIFQKFTILNRFNLCSWQINNTRLYYCARKLMA
jgi:hypothetical protein